MTVPDFSNKLYKERNLFMNDSKKLRLLADWFDWSDDMARWGSNSKREVQQDLRRIAHVLETDNVIKEIKALLEEYEDIGDINLLISELHRLVGKETSMSMSITSEAVRKFYSGEYDAM